MERRTALTQFGIISLTSISGCVRSPLSSRKSVQDKSRSLTLAGSDQVADEFEVNITAILRESLVTEEHPACLQIETENWGESRYFVSMREGLHFHPEYGGERSDRPRGLVLQHADEEYTATGDKWQLEPYDDGSAGLPGIVIDTGETVSNEYLVLDDSTVSGYYSPDTYRFEAPIVIRPDAKKGEPSGIVAEFTWGFSLKVEE